MTPLDCLQLATFASALTLACQAALVPRWDCLSPEAVRCHAEHWRAAGWLVVAFSAIGLVVAWMEGR